MGGGQWAVRRWVGGHDATGPIQAVAQAKSSTDGRAGARMSSQVRVELQSLRGRMLAVRGRIYKWRRSVQCTKGSRVARH